MHAVLLHLVAIVLDRPNHRDLLLGYARLHRHDITNPAAQRQQGDHQGQQEQAHDQRNDKSVLHKFPRPVCP